MMRAFHRLLRSGRGGTAAEFALVLPVLLFFLIGIIDAGRLMWTWNKAEKATQMGARFAVVTGPVPSGLVNYSFVGVGGLTQGDIVPAGAYGTMTCEQPSGTVTCACTTGTCPWGTGATAASFTNVYDRMRKFLPELATSNLQIDYSPSGLGFAGNPNGADIAPLVTVRLRNMTFMPIMMRIFGSTIALPDFRASLTLEDAAGTVSN
jgi:Flp pilus assembly pilin Flp